MSHRNTASKDERNNRPELGVTTRWRTTDRTHAWDELWQRIWGYVEAELKREQRDDDA